MSRIDEIKERFVKWETPTPFDEDIEYLLSRLEIAEQVLDHLSMNISGISKKEFKSMVQMISNEALEKIRS